MGRDRPRLYIDAPSSGKAPGCFREMLLVYEGFRGATGRRAPGEAVEPILIPVTDDLFRAEFVLPVFVSSLRLQKYASRR